MHEKYSTERWSNTYFKGEFSPKNFPISEDSALSLKFEVLCSETSDWKQAQRRYNQGCVQNPSRILAWTWLVPPILSVSGMSRCLTATNRNIGKHAAFCFPNVWLSFQYQRVCTARWFHAWCGRESAGHAIQHFWAQACRVDLCLRLLRLRFSNHK